MTQKDSTKSIEEKSKKKELKPIPEYEGLYSITEDGDVFGHKYNRFLKPALNRRGYRRVDLYKNGKGRTSKIHRLVSITYIPNTENKREVNHIDGNKLNNHISNLEWCTRSENLKHAFKNNLHKIDTKIGEDHNNAKLKEVDVIEIRRLLKDTNMTQKQIGIDFGVRQATISLIKLRKLWSHIWALKKRKKYLEDREQNTQH